MAKIFQPKKVSVVDNWKERMGKEKKDKGKKEKRKKRKKKRKYIYIYIC